MNEQNDEVEVTPLRSNKVRRLKVKPSKKLYAALGILLAIVIVVIYYVYSILDFANRISDPDESRFGNVQKDEDLPPVWEGTDRINILLLGGDSRGLKKDEPPRTDSMILASIDPVSKQAHLFSILRDTYANIPGHGQDRINAAITIGGPALAMKTVSELTGLSVQYYVYTDFQGFIALIDELGGIRFEVEKRMRYTDNADDPQFNIDLKPGLQQLDGRTALQYVRFRHDRLSDFTRTERQRNFLTAIAEKLKTTTSLLKLPMLLDSVSPHIETNIRFEEMVKLGRLGFEIDTDNIASVQLPPLELLREEEIGSADVITITNTDKLLQFVQEQFIPSVPEAPETTATP